jgi:glycosyltransferase involved in cell wall biosynthesis
MPTSWRAYESDYLRYFTRGSESPKQSVNGGYYDRTIPNYFDAKDFPYQPNKKDYFLFIGRMIHRKGVWTAINATREIGAKLVLAGQMSEEEPLNWGNQPHCNYVGYVDPEKRSRLMGEAKAVFVPTLYLEAFGGVNVEAQLCGTPVITTNFGVFPETVVHGVTGYRCNTFDDFVWAARHVDRLKPKKIRKHATRYLMSNVRWEYQAWFDDLYQWYLSIPEDGTRGWSHVRKEDPEWRSKLW